MAKTILLENYNLLSPQTETWILGIDKNYEMINSESRNYSREDDMYTFAMFIDPKLRTIATSSAFVTQMPYEAIVSFRKEKDFNIAEENAFTQLDYYSWVLFNAVRFRSRAKMAPLTLEINYHNIDFLEDLRDEKLGVDTKTYLKRMFRQQEGDIVMNLYKDYKLIKTIRNEDDLELDKKTKRRKAKA